jgi:phage/plasmid-associated DNA primase
MNDLAGEFGLQGITDKRVLVLPDAHATDTTRRGTMLERIKSITGNDVLSVNRKNLGIVNVKIPARLVLVCNQMPKFLDESGALAARQLPLVFGNSFVGKEDRELRQKLVAELPGIANWALEGLRRLRANGNKFTVGAKGRAAIDDIRMGQSPALRFIRDHFDVTGDPADFVPLDCMHPLYIDWGAHVEHLSGRETRNREDFKSDVMAALMSKGVKFERQRWHPPGESKHGAGKRYRGFVGIKPKEGVNLPHL